MTSSACARARGRFDRGRDAHRLGHIQHLELHAERLGRR